jgi:hypothetical protein
MGNKIKVSTYDREHKYFRNHKTSNYKMPNCANFKICQNNGSNCASKFKLLKWNELHSNTIFSHTILAVPF